MSAPRLPTLFGSTNIPIVALLLLAVVTPASAAPLTFTVNSIFDIPDATPGDNVCETALGTHVCTLRAAIQEANAHAGNDTIVLQAGATYVLTRVGAADDTALNGDLDINHSVTITGSGAASTIIDGNGSVTKERVFQIAAAATVSISGVTIRNGNSSTLGGGILNDGTLTLSDSSVTGNVVAGANDWGGGIYNSGTMSIVRSDISGNMTGNHNAYGGGIMNQGEMTITDSTISGNATYGGSSPFSPGFGGGIFTTTLHVGDELRIQNSTISGNSAAVGGGIHKTGAPLIAINSTISGNFSAGDGGGIYASAGTTSLFNVTITQNTANSDEVGVGIGGGITSAAGATVIFLNSIIAQNEFVVVTQGGNLLKLDDCAGTLTSLSINNIMGADGDGVDTSHCTVGGTYTAADPALGPLQDNGGPTQTHALLAGSPAIDAGTSGGCTDDLSTTITQDQRGIARPQDGDANHVAKCDIGAYELGTPATASLRKPKDGATNATTRPHLKWKATPGALDYHLQLRQGSVTGTLVVDTTTSRTKLTAPQLTNGTTYVWHVRACDDIGCGKYSAYRSFKVTQ